jgi:hypothetical protein
MSLAVATSSAAAVTTIDFGGFALSISDSWTAQVFHVVDQLSEWDQFAHKQYGRWAAKNLTLDDTDTRLLRQHAELRKARGWGNGFEQAFYVDDDIETAAEKAASSGLLTPQEADAERAILLHFSARLASLRESGAATISAFRSRLTTEYDQIRPLVQQLLRLAGTGRAVAVPVFLVVNPEEGSGGGGFNGGRLVVEVQPRPDPLPMLMHESMHALLVPHAQAIAEAANAAGLSSQALNEGIAYALAPGLTQRTATADALVDALVQRLTRGAAVSDSYVQFYMIAGVLRPLLQTALESGDTLDRFLPKAAERWRQVSGREK